MYAVFQSNHKKVLVTTGIGLRDLSSAFASCAQVPVMDNSFRGGSRGKGGKIKYARK